MGKEYLVEGEQLKCVPVGGCVVKEGRKKKATIWILPLLRWKGGTASPSGTPGIGMTA